MLEGQRYLWMMSRQRSQAAVNEGESRPAGVAESRRADPNLAEGYTALSELALTTPPNDIEEAILLANLALK